MKHGLREIRINLGLFDLNVLFVFGEHSKLEKYLRWKYEDKTITLVETKPNIPRGQTYGKPGYVPVVWMPRLPKTISEIATLAHESSHVMTAVLDWLDTPESRAADEIRGHGIGLLVRRILAAANNRKDL